MHQITSKSVQTAGDDWLINIKTWRLPYLYYRLEGNDSAAGPERESGMRWTSLQRNGPKLQKNGESEAFTKWNTI